MGIESSTSLTSPIDQSVINGLLLGASPKNVPDQLYKSVILLSHTVGEFVLGLQINRPLVGISLASIITKLGYDFDVMSSNVCSQQVYYGGLLNGNRLHFVHSLDWIGDKTQILAGGIGVTSDLSIVQELTTGGGPSVYRACVGMWRWDINSLKDQIMNEAHSIHSWEVVPIESQLVFQHTQEMQWYSVLKSSGQYQASFWMN